MKGIKVLVQGREDFLVKPGGDYFSILDKINDLKLNGVLLEFNSDPTISLEEYDLVHIQQSILNTNNVKLQLNNAIKWNKPVVLKPFYNPEKDGSNYLKNGQSYLIKILYKIINNYYTYIKIRNMFYLFYNKNYIHGLKQIFTDIKKEQARIINNTFIIPDSYFELQCLEEEIVNKVNNFHIVTASLNTSKELDAVSALLFKKKYGLTDFVFCVGRIEPLKNQVNLLKTMQGENIDVVIEGQMQPYHRSYNKKFKKLIDTNTNFHWIDKIDRNMLFSAFKNAHVVALPSWTETAGMTGLEGGYYDCNIVATERGACKEYFQDSAWYLDPGNPDSIRLAVLDAYNSPKGCRSFKKRISSDYSLEKTSLELFNAYQQTIKIFNERCG